MLIRADLPHARPGETIGLLGGSFDPPHAGHLFISRMALMRFGLDRIWWLVSPGNPLKAHGPADLGRRMAAARAMAHDPRIIVTDFESRVGTRFTAQTLARLFALYPGQRFVWLMGSDNLVQFHRWERWEWILSSLPVGVLARPGSRLAARGSLTARRYRAFRLPMAQMATLARSAPPAWCLANLPLRVESSSAIRRHGLW